MTRKRLRAETEEAVLVRSRRRCAICFGLDRDIRIKRGQIAHLDRRNSNNSLANLAFLCLEHHDAYDSTARQSKGFRASEVRAYRDELYRSVIPALKARAAGKAQVPSATPRRASLEPSARLAVERRKALLELIGKADSHRGHTLLALKLGLPGAQTERMLAQLAEDGLVRVDREHATLKKTYSLAASRTNRLIDTFLATLKEDVVSERRYVRKGLVEVDAVVVTRAASYVVDTLLVANSVSRSLLVRRVSALATAKRSLGLSRARRVLLVGITNASTLADPRMKDLEQGGLMVKYVDLGSA